MKNSFDFKDLMAFGMFIIALLTFIFVNCHQYNKTFPVLWLVGKDLFLYTLVNHSVAIAFYNFIIANIIDIARVF